MSVGRSAHDLEGQLVTVRVGGRQRPRGCAVLAHRRCSICSHRSVIDRQDFHINARRFRGERIRADFIVALPRVRDRERYLGRAIVIRIGSESNRVTVLQQSCRAKLGTVHGEDEFFVGRFHIIDQIPQVDLHGSVLIDRHDRRCDRRSVVHQIDTDKNSCWIACLNSVAGHERELIQSAEVLTGEINHSTSHRVEIEQRAILR